MTGMQLPATRIAYYVAIHQMKICTFVIPENHNPKTENYPFITPKGLSLATFLAIPAPWTTSTTPATSL